MRPMVYIKTYIFNHFYQLNLVLLTMVPRNKTKVDATEGGANEMPTCQKAC